MSLCISVPLLILGILLLGKSFGIKTLYITFAAPVCMKFVPYIDFSGLLSGLPHLVMLFLASVIGGLLVGGSVGIALNHNCATGGTDLVASGIISGDFMIAVFSLLSLFIIIHTIKFITSGKNEQ